MPTHVFQGSSREATSDNNVGRATDRVTEGGDEYFLDGSLREQSASN